MLRARLRRLTKRAPRVVVVSGPRPAEPMGLPLAERRLLEALPEAAEGLAVPPLRVVGGRAARRYAREIGGRWIPAPPGRSWEAAWHGGDLVHLVGLDLPPPRRRRFVATIFDLAPLRYDDEGTMPPWFDEVVKRAALLLTPSAFSASELQAVADVPPERIRVFGLAPVVEAARRTPLARRELAELGIESPFVLRSGGYTQRKNVSLLLQAWREISDATLVLVGPAQPARARLLAEARPERVVVLDYVPEALLARLIRSATLVVSSSLYEGFGLPPLEALAAGTPVVAVRTPFAEEVCGDAALLVGADPASLRAGMTRVLTDQNFAAQLAAAGRKRCTEFTWSRVAHRVVSAYEAALAG
jgi:glycosyltransferase involved in cell wall biosynthesis